MLFRVSPLTPTRCKPVAFGLSPENPCQTWDKGAKFRILILQNTKFEGPPFEPWTSAHLAGSASVLVRVLPLMPTRCNPVAFGFKPRESVSNLGHMGQISYLNRIKRKV